MVFVPFDHALAALDKGVGPVRVVAKFVVKGMGFDVGFVNDIKPIFVAQLVPAAVVGIMAGTHGVDIKLLHQLDVGHHRGFGDSLAQFVVVIVAINAFHQDRLTVDE